MIYCINKTYVAFATRDTIYGTTPQYRYMLEDLSINSWRSPDLSISQSKKQIWGVVQSRRIFRVGRAACCALIFLDGSSSNIGPSSQVPLVTLRRLAGRPDPEIGEVHRCMISMDLAIASSQGHWDRTVYLEERAIGTKKKVGRSMEHLSSRSTKFKR